MHMLSSTILKKTSALILIFVVFLISFELILRLIGLFLNFDQTLDNFKNNNIEERRFKILCIGESTTSQMFANNLDSSWPKLLENLLNEKEKELGFKTIVFNEGIPGTNTKIISLRLESLLKKYKPDLVVSMMGINDTNDLLGIKLKNVNMFVKFLKQLNAFKVVKYYFPNVFSDYSIESNFIEPNIKSTLKDRLDLFLKSKSNINLKALLKFYDEVAQELPTPQDRGNYHQYVAAQLHYLFMADPKNRSIDTTLLQVCREYLDKTFIISELNAYTVYRMATCAQNNQPALIKTLETAVNLSKHGVKLNNPTISLFLSRKNIFPESQFLVLLKSHNLELIDSTLFNWSTQESYNQIYDLLQRKNILYVPMMYPTGIAENLKYLLSKNKIPPQRFIKFMYAKDLSNLSLTEKINNQLIIVSNENFLTKCTETIGDCYTDIWTKSEGGHFGHTTLKGHQLIAENLFNELFKNKDKLKINTIKF